MGFLRLTKVRRCGCDLRRFATFVSGGEGGVWGDGRDILCYVSEVSGASDAIWAVSIHYYVGCI